MGDRRHAPWWFPYVGLAVVVGGWLIQYGMERAKHTALEQLVERLEAQQHVTNGINYREHPAYWPEILAAEKEK